MGIKGDKKQPTNEQVRLARLTLEGNSADDEAGIQKKIKKIIETTSCTASQAEIALHDNNYDIYAAIDHILESDKLDSWTDPKAAKKEKKKQDDERVITKSFTPRGRGSSGFTERGGRGRSNGAPRENNRDNNREQNGSSSQRPGRGGFERPSTFSGRGGRGGGRGGYSRAVDSSNQSNGEKSVKVDTTVSEFQAPVEESVTTTVATSSAPAPISFAAVAAAAHRKEELRKQQLTNPQSAIKRRSVSPAPVPEPVEDEPEQHFEEPESSNQEEKHEENFYQSDQSVVSDEPVAVSSHIDDNVQSSPSQANVWTKQLKSELGIGLTETAHLAPTSPIPSNVSIQSVHDKGVEFVGAEPTGINDYSFGYVEAPIMSTAETSSASISTHGDNLFNTSRLSAASKSVEPERTQLTNGEFGIKTDSPPNAFGQTNRLSYDTSSVSYAPNDRVLPTANKSQYQSSQLPVQPSPPQQQQSQQQQAPQPPQQSQHHPQQPMLFPHQLPYAPYSYMNYMSPYNGVREDQYAALMQCGIGVDLSNLSTILPQTGGLNQATPNQPLQSGQQRADSHGLMDFNKFGTQSSRDQQQQQQPSNVGPPPGFQASNYMQQPLSSLFMQQPYPTAPPAFQFMNLVPPVGSNGGGRQMYGQDDDRKTYDKMSSKPSTQQNQHSQYSHNGGSLGMYGNKNKAYNWTS